MLEVRQLHARYGDSQVLFGIDIDVPAQGGVALLGRNGAGKSTLMKIIARMNEPDEGGVDMPRGSRIGYIAQEAPHGTQTPIEAVLAADTERAALLEESERIAYDPDGDMERIGEIGLRRAIGATRRQIAQQFVVESVVLGLLGGLLGAAAGVLAVLAVSLAQHWTPVLDPLVAFGGTLLGSLIGLLAGSVPARRASRIEPVAALRGS